MNRKPSGSAFEVYTESRVFSSTKGTYEHVLNVLPCIYALDAEGVGAGQFYLLRSGIANGTLLSKKRVDGHGHTSQSDRGSSVKYFRKD